MTCDLLARTDQSWTSRDLEIAQKRMLKLKAENLSASASLPHNSLQVDTVQKRYTSLVIMSDEAGPSRFPEEAGEEEQVVNKNKRHRKDKRG